MLKTYKGSCHCGAVAYEADIDLANGTGRCNCSICRKSRNWSAIIKPEAFRLLSKPEEMTEYSFGTGAGKYKFCKRCGVHSFSTGYVEDIGGEFVSVRVNCLDDVADEELATVPVNFANGRDNAWWNKPMITCHL
ncbi:GFA family protein [Microvirga sp. GCM10011540]|uniref:GFA family protein n=1 Tax=Microvirga sp. GCM10011540 TaxID=3317338 RepID=UPI00361D5E15